MGQVEHARARSIPDRFNPELEHRRKVILWFAAALLIVPPLAAQAVDLRVRDDSTRRPVAGAIARLQDGSGKAVVQGLTSETGRILLKAPAAGTYRVRVDAIGFRGSLGEATQLRPGDPVRVEIGITREPPMLPTLVVTADSRCDSRPGQGTLAGILWEDIRKALTAERLTQESEQEPLMVTIFERLLNVREVLLRETVISTRRTSRQPFASLPPEDLARHGFVRTIADTESYSGPDAALLLSEAFVGTHCFRALVPSGAQSPLLGLGFEPTRGRKVSDIRGVLWMDRESRELRHIEYWYTGLRGAAAGSRAGGRIEFRRLPRGTWIVGYWYIRMPDIGKIVRGEDLIPTGRDSLLGYFDRGGRADLIQASATITNQPSPAVLSGTVYDSLDSRWLAGAVVRVGGLADTIMTDSTGGFRFEVPERGSRLVTIRHPRLGLVADRSSQEVALTAGEEVRIDVAVPAIDAFVRVFCLGERPGGVRLLGQVFDEGGAVLEGLSVRVGWLASVGSGRLRYETLTVRSAARGIYAHCNIPPNRMVTVQLIRGTEVLVEVHTSLDTGESRWMDLRPVPR